jgi:hypothetical protein
MGSLRLSSFSYSEPILADGETDFKNQVLSFCKYARNPLKTQLGLALDILKDEKDGDKIRICDLPTAPRVCMNLILLPEQGSCKKLKPVKPNKTKSSFIVEGLVLGSVQVPIFDEQFYMRQGPVALHLWPYKAYNAFMVCTGQYYVKNTKVHDVSDFKHRTTVTHYASTLQLKVKFKSYHGGFQRVAWRI